MSPERVRHYRVEWDSRDNRVRGLEALGRQVLEDLWGELDEETKAFAEAPSLSWQDAERTTLVEFVEEFSRGFVGRSDTVRELVRFALAPSADEGDDQPWAMVVTGEAGSGKSSLFARIARDLETEDCVVLSHAAGISSRSGTVDSLLKRWNQELCRHLGTEELDGPVVRPSALEARFAELLSRATVRDRVVCLVDALDQFEPTAAAQHLTWLPGPWPRNARLIATAIPGEEVENLGKRRGVRELKLLPLTGKDAVAIVKTVCRRYHKYIYDDVVDTLVAKTPADGSRAAGNPLWLSIALEELLLLDEDDFAELGRFMDSGDPMHSLLLGVAKELPPTVEDIYPYLFSRAERRFGHDWVRAVMGFLAVSRHGLREIDLRKLVVGFLGAEGNGALDSVRFAGLRRYLRAHLVRRGEQDLWDYSHAQARLSLEKGLPSDPEGRQDLHRRVAGYLGTLDPSDPLRQTEIINHYYRGADGASAANYLAGELTPAETDGSARGLAELIVEGLGSDTNPGLEWASDLLAQPALEPVGVGSICWLFADSVLPLLADYSPVITRVDLLMATNKALVRLLEKEPDAVDPLLMVRTHASMAELLGEWGDLQASRVQWEGIVGLSGLQGDLPGLSQSLVLSYAMLGRNSYFLGQREAALSYATKCYRLAAELCGQNPTDDQASLALALAHFELSFIRSRSGESSLAVQDLWESVRILERLSCRVPGDMTPTLLLADAYGELGRQTAKMGSMSQARQFYEKQLGRGPADPGDRGSAFPGPPRGQPRLGLGPRRDVIKEHRVFGATTPDILELTEWLEGAGCTHVAMESSGSYWKPIYNLLEGKFALLVVNAQHIKAVPGRKTDTRDAEWIADLLRHGLLRSSFIPSRDLRELRELTRYRKALIHERADELNRLQKVLEGANIKLASVATQISGVSARAMLGALSDGHATPEAMADLARGRMRKKIPELRSALIGSFGDHQRYLVSRQLGHVDYLDREIAECGAEIERRLAPERQAVDALCTIPGVGQKTAECILAEIGTDMSRFPSHRHLASWAGLCPGNHESAGKRLSGRTRNGNRAIREALVEAALAAARTRNTYLSALYHRLAARRGGKRAVVAVAHAILVIAYHLLANGRVYVDLGPNYFDHRAREKVQARLTRRLEAMGFEVTVTERVVAAS